MNEPPDQTAEFNAASQSKRLPDEKLLREHIMPCRAVHHVNTSFVLRSNKYTTALPLEE